MSAPDANGSSSQPPTAEPLLSHQLSSFPPETPSKEEPPIPVRVRFSLKRFLVGNLDWIYLFMVSSLAWYTFDGRDRLSSRCRAF